MAEHRQLAAIPAAPRGVGNLSLAHSAAAKSPSSLSPSPRGEEKANRNKREIKNSLTPLKTNNIKFSNRNKNAFSGFSSSLPFPSAPRITECQPALARSPKPDPGAGGYPSHPGGSLRSKPLKTHNITFSTRHTSAFYNSPYFRPLKTDHIIFSTRSTSLPPASPSNSGSPL
jgi:hypothetical protein